MLRKGDRKRFGGGGRGRKRYIFNNTKLPHDY